MSYLSFCTRSYICSQGYYAETKLELWTLVLTRGSTASEALSVPCDRRWLVSRPYPVILNATAARGLNSYANDRPHSAGQRFNQGVARGGELEGLFCPCGPHVL